MTSPKSTHDALGYHTHDYRALGPLDAFQFAGTLSHLRIESAVVEPYGTASAGLAAYGGLRSLDETSPAFAYHLRVSREAQLVVSARRPHPDSATFEQRRLKGTWVYGGELMHHFGHFMAESSHRMYPMMQEANHYDGLLFSARAIKPWHHDLITEIYKIPESRVRLITDHAAVVDDLHVFPQGAILGGGAVAPGYLDHLHRMQKSRGSASRLPKRVFLGRGHLATGGGGVANEPMIAEAVRSEGFVSLRPEELPLREQLALVAGAEEIVMVGGSAVHLFDHIASSSARVFLIDRGDPDSFYHPRSLQGKVARLDRYVADSSRGDVITEFDNSGRKAFLTRYSERELSHELTRFLHST